MEDLERARQAENISFSKNSDQQQFEETQHSIGLKNVLPDEVYNKFIVNDPNDRISAEKIKDSLILLAVDQICTSFNCQINLAKSLEQNKYIWARLMF